MTINGGPEVKQPPPVKTICLGGVHNAPLEGHACVLRTTVYNTCPTDSTLLPAVVEACYPVKVCSEIFLLGCNLQLIVLPKGAPSQTKLCSDILPLSSPYAAICCITFLASCIT